MTPPRKKPKFLYSEQAMKLAIEAVKRGESALSVSKQFNVPRSTLVNKIKGKSPVGRRMGPAPIFGDKGEEMLVNWIKGLAVRGFPIWKEDLVCSVEQIIKDLKLPNNFTNNRPGRKWLFLFFKRHPECAMRTVEKLSRIRAEVTEEKVRNWFNEVTEYLEVENLLHVMTDSSRIYNLDETAFMLCPRSEKVIGIRGQKNVCEVVTAPEKESITVLSNVCADGKIAPTMIVFPGMRLPQGIKLSVPDSWAISRSEKGWMNGEVFFEYVANIFYPWLLEQNTNFPIVLFLDGHSSHLTYHLSKFCSDKQIVLVALYPNSTHVLQPLDVAIFKPLKQSWSRKVHDWRMKHCHEHLTKYIFAPMLKEVLDQSLKEKTVQNGFRKCGLFPWDQNAVEYSKLDVLHNTAEMVSSRSENCAQLKENVHESDCQKFVNTLESFISHDLLHQFKETYNKFTPIWDGSESAHDLYVVWKKAMDQLNTRPTNKLPSSDNSYAKPQSQEEVDAFSTPSMSGTPDHINNDQLIETPNHQITKTPQQNQEQTDDTHRMSITAEENNPQQPVTTPDYLLPSTSTSCSGKGNLMKTLSPHTNGENVPSPFKRHLFWPGTPKKKGKKRASVKIPSVVSSKDWQDFEKKRMENKKKKEQEKEERKLKREMKKKEKGPPVKRSVTGRPMPKSKVNDIDEDWICKVCQNRYSSELIIGTRRRWVECDQCKCQFHYKCIPKKHLNCYGIEEDDEDEDDVAFICHFCINEESDCDLANLLSDEGSESDF